MKEVFTSPLAHGKEKKNIKANKECFEKQGGIKFVSYTKFYL